MVHRLILTCALVLLPSLAAAQVTYDNSVVQTEAVGGQTTITTGSFTVGSGSDRYCVVIYNDRNNGTVSSVTCAGQAAASLGTAPAGNGRRVQLFGVIAPTSGSQTCNVTGNAALGDNGSQQVVCITFAGVHQSASTTGYQSQQVNASSSTLTVTGVGANDFVVDGIIHLDLTTAGANQTERANASGMGASTQDGADGGEMSWSAAGAGELAHAAIGLLAAGGVASTCGQGLTLTGAGKCEH